MTNRHTPSIFKITPRDQTVVLLTAANLISGYLIGSLNTLTFILGLIFILSIIVRRYPYTTEYT